MSFHYDILPEPKDSLEMIMFAAPLQVRMQTFTKALINGEQMTPEEIDVADRVCYACAGVDYSRRQEADDWRICMKLTRIIEGGRSGREAMEKLKAEFDEKTEDELWAAIRRVKKSLTE